MYCFNCNQPIYFCEVSYKYCFNCRKLVCAVCQRENEVAGYRPDVCESCKKNLETNAAERTDVSN